MHSPDASPDTALRKPPDFFISYTQVDGEWARWIAYVLEDAGYTVFFQEWDFRPGHNFVLQMHAGATARRTIIVLTPTLLESHYPQAEWAAAFAADPEGICRKLIPVRVKHCKPEGVLAPIQWIDLVAVSDREQAKAILLDGVREGRAKPAAEPAFPFFSPEQRR